jgi:hypothetical protein
MPKGDFWKPTKYLNVTPLGYDKDMLIAIKSVIA